MFRKAMASLPLLTGGLLLERLVHASRYNCRPKTYSLIVANYANLTMLLLLLWMQASVSRYSPYRPLLTTLALLSALFFFIFNFLGFGWFLDELLGPKSCIKTSDYFFLGVIFVLMVLLLIGGFVFILLAVIQRRNHRLQQQLLQFQRDPEVVKNDLIRRNLASIYKNPLILGRQNVEKFFENQELSGLMVKLPLLSAEKKLVFEHFTTTLDEDRLQAMGSEEAAFCAVCFLEFVVQENGCVFDCGHCFHKGCIEEWMKIKVNCPTCRANVRRDLVRRLLKQSELKQE